MTILFDLDGTLIDSTEAILESFAVAYESFGEPVPDEAEIRRRIGEPLSKMFAEMGVAKASVEAHVAAYKAHYRNISRQKTVLLPTAREAVERAAGFARLGVVTTKTGKYSIELLEHLGLMSFFEALVGSEDVTRHKPHPEPVLEALRRMGCDTRDCWMVGDTLMDIEAARAAGVEPFAVTCGYAPAETLAKACENVAPNPLFAVVEIEKRKSLL
ncbi:HAD family hydrolase [Hydrogenimonas sp.]